MARPHRRRFATLAVLPLLAATSCAIQPETGEFLVDPSGLTTVLQSSCSPDPVQGPLHVSVSDRNAHAYITEPDSGRIWIRNPMGLVADHCYWVTTDTEREGWPADTRPGCFVDELRQDGTCPGDALAPPEWLFIHGGFIDVQGLNSKLAIDERYAAAWSVGSRSSLRLVDLVPDDDECPEGQHARTYNRISNSLDVPAGYTGFAEGDLAILGGERLVSLSPVDDQLGVWTLPLPCEQGAAMTAPVRVDLPCTPDGPLALDIAGDRAFALCSSSDSMLTVSGLRSTEPTVERRRLTALGGATDVAYDALTDTVWVASPEAGDGKVIKLPADGGSATVFAADGAFQLALGETELAGERTSRVYAVGGSRVYRFDPVDDTAEAQEMGENIRAVGAGYEMQQLVLVTDADDGSVVVRGALDVDHLAAQQDDSVHMLVAAFLEYPRDQQLDDAFEQSLELATEPAVCADVETVTAGWPALDREMYLVCCVNRARADQVADGLDYLERAVVSRMGAEDDAPILLAINSTVMLQASHCIHAGLELGHDELVELGLPLLEVVGEGVRAMEDDGGLLPVLLVHTAAGDEDQVPYSCPEYWDPGVVDPDCDIDVENLAQYVDFLLDLKDTASLERVAEAYQGTGGCAAGELPLSSGCLDLGQYGITPRAYSGGFDKAAGLYQEHGEIYWGDAFVQALPGESPFTYFGGGGSYPGSGHGESKELVPWDARSRLGPFQVGPDPWLWDQPDEDNQLTYLPGVTISHTMLYEVARSGLYSVDMHWHAAPLEAQWSTDQWPGEESTEVMDVADFAVLNHYLVYHRLASRQADRTRSFYFHLPDMGALAQEPWGDGRVACTEQGNCEQRDALQDWIDGLDALGPALHWGLPKEFQ